MASQVAARGGAPAAGPAIGIGRRTRRGAGGAAVLLASSLVSGCLLPSIQGAPPRAVPLQSEIADLRPFLGAVDFAQATNTPYRDAVVSARMRAIDLNYTAFATELSRERRNIGFLSAIGVFGLTQTATLMTPVVTKDILTAVAGGLVLAEQAYDQEILAERTVQVLLLQMQADRARVATRILTGLRAPGSDYPLIAALQDVEEYYRAGTIASALTSVTEAAGVEVRVAEAARAAVVTARFSDDDQSAILRRHLMPDGRTIDQAKLRQVLDRLRTLGVDVDISLLLYGDGHRELRRQVVTSLGWS